MPPDPAALPARGMAVMAAGARLSPIPALWEAPLARLATAALLVVAVCRADWAAMAGQWWNSSTYHHILLVPAILAWLVAQRAPALAAQSPRGWWPGLVLLGGALLLWVLGRFAGLQEVSEAGAIAALAALVPLLLGVRTAAVLAFPLLFMAFLLPFGDELVPLLQTVTARLTIALVHLSGVRAAVDGVFITTPAGLFEIAEACSGVKFLIAMVAFGALAANVCFISPLRRAGFMALAVAVPILANSVRAWGTIYVAQSRGAAYAGGVDHLIYGWIFFALVIAATIALAWRWFDRPVAAPMVDAGSIAASPLFARLERAGVRPRAALAAAVALGGAALLWVQSADRLSAPLPNAIVLPAVPGWQRIAYRPDLWWEPRAMGAGRRVLGRYTDAAGDEVDVFAALYASQGPGRKAGAVGEGAARPDIGWVWQATQGSLAGVRYDRLLAQGGRVRLAQTAYRSGTLLTGSDLRLRLANVADRLSLRARPTMLLVLSAQARPAHDPAAALARFRSAIGPLGAWMDGIARLR